jgi:hypothetical protein
VVDLLLTALGAVQQVHPEKLGARETGVEGTGVEGKLGSGNSVSQETRVRASFVWRKAGDQKTRVLYV